MRIPIAIPVDPKILDLDYKVFTLTNQALKYLKLKSTIEFNSHSAIPTEISFKTKLFNYLELIANRRIM